MESIVKYLGHRKGGRRSAPPRMGEWYHISKCGNIVDFNVTKINDIIEKIIPFFENNPIIGVKSKDFDDFKKLHC
jgi:hypothetical protein